MTIQPGEFWIANIPFTNGLSSKKRPVLVLWTDGNSIDTVSNYDLSDE
jgi:mRNA interferase MazF